MATFTKAFFDFSLGEIDKNNVNANTHAQYSKGVSLLDSMDLTDTRSLRRRTGTLHVASPKYPVDAETDNVVSIPMFAGKGLAYVGMLYVVDTGDLDSSQLLDMADDSGIGFVPVDAKVLVIDWFKSTGFTETYSNSNVLYLDSSVPLSSLYYGAFPKTKDNSWLDLYGFSVSRFQTFGIVTHNTGCLEPFVFSVQENSVDWFLHRQGLTVTNYNYWPVSRTSNAFAVPFDESNLNPMVALKLDQHSDNLNVLVTAQWYSKATEVYGDWSTTTNSDDPSPKPHPLSKRTDYLRVTYLNNSYILRYVGSETSPGNFEMVDDLTDYDNHLFSIVIDAEDPQDLWSVLASDAITLTDFNLESWTITDGYPDNSIFYDQRLVFTRDGRIYNSNTGNAFFFNQYRFPQDELFECSIYTPIANPSERRYLPLIIEYSGDKIASDAFDFIPLSESIVDVSWINKSTNLEFGNYTEINNISGLEDSIYSFDSIRSVLGAAYGSKKSVSIKANNDTIFIDGSNQSIRNYYYSGQSRSYVSSNLNDLNPDIINHLLGSTVDSADIEILNISYDNDTQTIYAVIGPTQALIACDYDRVSNKMCWKRVTIGGYESEFNPIPVYSACFLRNDKSSSYTFVTTKRDGVFYLEKMAKHYNKNDMNAFNVFGGSVSEENLPYYLDFSKGFVGSISGNFLVGEEYANTDVSVLADGYWIDNVAVDSSGYINLDRNVRTLVVGYKYKSRFRSIDIEPNLGAQGDTLHWQKSINYVFLQLKSSYAGQITTSSVMHLEDIPYDETNMMVDDSLNLFTGGIPIHLLQTSDEDNNVYIETDAPYPFEILSLSVKGEVNER